MFVYLILYCITLLGLLFQVNANKSTKKWYLFTVFSILTFFALLRSTNVGTDLHLFYASYYPKFATASWNNIQHVTSSAHWEWGFCALCKILSMINPDPQFFIMVTSLVTVIPYAFFIYYNSDDVVFPTVFYVGMHVYSMSLNIIRQSLAIGIILIGIVFFKRKQYIRFFIISIVATSMHTSAVAILLLFVLQLLIFKRRTIISLSIITLLFGVMYQRIISTLMSIPFLSNEYDIYQVGVGHAAGYITIHTLGLFFIPLLIFLLSVFGYENNFPKQGKSHTRYIDKVIFQSKKGKAHTEWKNSLLMYSAYMAVLLRFCAFLVNALARIAYYYMPFLMITYPKMRSNQKNITYQKLMDIMVYSSITIFFIYICVYRAHDLWGVIPYQFFWNI